MRQQFGRACLGGMFSSFDAGNFAAALKKSLAPAAKPAPAPAAAATPGAPRPPSAAAAPAPAASSSGPRGWHSDGMMSDRLALMRAQAHLLGGTSFTAPHGSTAPKGSAAGAKDGSERAKDGGATIIGPTIGIAGEGEAPQLETLQLTGTITLETDDPQVQNARVRDASGEVIGRIEDGSTVTIVNPQPEGGPEGHIYVRGLDPEGNPVEGWVSNQYPDLVEEHGDPRVQARMEALGYIPPDGELTEDAIAEFQQMNGLRVTGQLNDETLEEMWSADARISTHVTQVTDDTWNHSTDSTHNNNCGPTAVAVALAATGIRPIDNADPQAAVDAARASAGDRTDDDDLTGPDHLEASISAAGGLSYRVHDLEEVEEAVRNGDPVILYGTRSDGTKHWVTVLGYDPDSDTFLVSDPLSETGVERWDRERMEDYADFSVDSLAVGLDPSAIPEDDFLSADSGD